MALTGYIDGVTDGVLRAWCWNPTDPAWRPEVLVCADGQEIGTWRADRMRGDLEQNGIGDGRHGLECPLPFPLQDGGLHRFTLHLAESEAKPEFSARAIDVPRRTHLLTGRLERLAGKLLMGWAWDRARPDAAVELELLVDDVPVATTRASRFRTDLLRAGIGRGAHGFAFDLDQLSPPPPAGAMLAVRAGAELDHWLLGTQPFVADTEAAKPPTAKSPPARPAGTTDAKASLKPEAASPAQAPRVALDAARDAERKRDFAEAARLADRGLARAPRDFDLLFTRARIAHSMSDTEAAERFARAALAERPGHPRPTVILARVAQAREQHAEAVVHWAAVPPGDSNYRERLIKRGRGLLLLARPLEALAEFAAAVRLDPVDRDALRGAAEATEATGAPRAALRRWRQLLGVIPEDAPAAERVRALEARLAAPPGLRSPLRNALLQEWPAGVAGTAGSQTIEPLPWVSLRSLATGAETAFAVAGGSERRPGELPGYGVWLRAAAGAELAFALDPTAAQDLRQGLRMAIELHAPAAAAAAGLEVLLLGAPGAPRLLLRAGLEPRRRLLRFDLSLGADEAASLGQGALRIGLRFAGACTVELMPPRPLSLLREASGALTGFELPGLARHPLLARPPRRAVGADPLRDTGRGLTVLCIEAGRDGASHLPDAVQAVLRETGTPLLCLVQADPDWPDPVRQALAAQEAADPRFRLVAPYAVPQEAVLLRLSDPARAA